MPRVSCTYATISPAPVLSVVKMELGLSPYAFPKHSTSAAIASAVDCPGAMSNPSFVHPACKLAYCMNTVPRKRMEI